MQKINISVVIITFNEERNILRCIESVKEVADEIIVIDSYSTDRTKEICLAAGIEFIENSFVGHVEQKNFAMRQSKFDYVLSLDADEALDDIAISSIKEIKSQWSCTGYSLNRLNRFCGKWVKHSGWYPDTKTRLVIKEHAQWVGQNPHDRLEVNGSTQRLKGNILHYTFNSIDEHINQINKFTSIAAQTLHEKGKKTTLLKVCFSPIFKFIRDYILKKGFLDGTTGFVIAKNSAHAKFLKYIKLYYLNKSNTK